MPISKSTLNGIEIPIKISSMSFINFCLILVFSFIINSNSLAQNDINNNLYYSNDNHTIDYLGFYNLENKVGLSRNEKSKGLNLYLIGKDNLIKDTLNVFSFQEMLFTERGLLLTGMNNYLSADIKNEKFINIKKEAFPKNINKNAEGLFYRGFVINEYLFGLRTEKKKEKEYVNCELVVFDFASQVEKKLMEDQKKEKDAVNCYGLIIKLHYGNGKLFCYNTGLQMLYVVNSESLAVNAYQFPIDNDYCYQYFYDHIKDQHYAVAEKSPGKFTLYSFSLIDGLVPIINLDYLPEAIVANSIHKIVRLEKGSDHYLIPIDFYARKAKENTIRLQEVLIKSN